MKKCVPNTEVIIAGIPWDDTRTGYHIHPTLPLTRALKYLEERAGPIDHTSLYLLECLRKYVLAETGYNRVLAIVKGGKG